MLPEHPRTLPGRLSERHQLNPTSLCSLPYWPVVPNACGTPDCVVAAFVRRALDIASYAVLGYRLYSFLPLCAGRLLAAGRSSRADRFGVPGRRRRSPRSRRHRTMRSPCQRVLRRFDPLPGLANQRAWGSLEVAAGSCSPSLMDGGAIFPRVRRFSSSPQGIPCDERPELRRTQPAAQP